MTDYIVIMDATQPISGVSVAERNHPMGLVTARNLKIGAAWYVLYEPLAKGFARCGFRVPRVGGYDDTRSPDTYSLRPLYCG